MKMARKSILLYTLSNESWEFTTTVVWKVVDFAFSGWSDNGLFSEKLWLTE